jgi:hypothetical protein
MNKRLTFETTYEFTLGAEGIHQVRIWFNADRVMVSRPNLWEMERTIGMHWAFTRSAMHLSELAEWIVETVPDIAAVQTIDKTTGFGNVIYVDWP